MAIATGSVGDGTGRPTSYLWDTLGAAQTREDVEQLRAHAAQQGYGPDGQLMRAAADRLAAFDAPVGGS